MKCEGEMFMYICFLSYRGLYGIAVEKVPLNLIVNSSENMSSQNVQDMSFGNNLYV